MRQKKLQERCSDIELLNSEVLAMEIVGEFLAIHTEKGLYTYFRRHYAEWFPALREVHRSTFSRQLANRESPRSSCGGGCCTGSASTRGPPWWTPS